MQNISIILATLTTFTTRGQTENEKMGSDMSISSEVPARIDELWPKEYVSDFQLFVLKRFSFSGIINLKILDIMALFF